MIDTIPLCEFRFDIPLSRYDCRQFERGWRSLLAAQHLTSLAIPPAQAVTATYRLCGPNLESEHTYAFSRYLTARLAALPGTPRVVADQSQPLSDWQGVRLWISYHAETMTSLLCPSKKQKARQNHFPYYSQKRRS